MRPTGFHVCGIRREQRANFRFIRSRFNSNLKSFSGEGRGGGNGGDPREHARRDFSGA